MAGGDKNSHTPALRFQAQDHVVAQYLGRNWTPKVLAIMKPRRKLKYSKDAITVHWISGHDDIIENEKANEETKRSAGGRDQYSQKRRLPLYLKHTSSHSAPQL
ncbi:hypothetical protein PAXINDRAFT_21538 [Paxillus involutus ATCC 200175]|uniref:Uncharacterized protein n=1 Tax=Paxillus involutus ATCC 200175 TaxID=664439 RepID=A0A0C9SLX4_PAXIN|nr:hypothetical protein PAXINDRAFT_21538 [Paxillus involutus ATCC 200175]